MQLTSIHIARYFLDIVKKENEQITKTKLIKLCYITYGYYYAIRKEKLFHDKIEAWQYGPVMPLLYGVLGSKNVFNQLLNPNEIAMDDQLKKFTQTIWDMYGDLSANELVNLTHKKHTPWYQTYDEFDWNKEIKDKLILKYYQKFVKKKNGQS